MEMRGRNGKWFGTGGRGTVRKVRVIVMFEFGPGIEEYGDHIGVRGEDSNWSRRRPVDGKKRAVGGKLAANFLFFNVEETSNVFNHLLVGESHF